MALLLARALQPGTTALGIAGSPPEDPAALDASGATVGEIAFDAAPASITAN